jgi:molecular chaperone GrpE
MSHDRREGRPDRPTGPRSGPQPSEPRTGGPVSGEAGWPGPSGLGGPGSEEFPVPKEPPAQGGSDAPGPPSGPGWAGPAAGATTGGPRTDAPRPDMPRPDTTAGPEAAGNGAATEAARQRDEYLDSLLRLQAEFDNYRKRVQRQQHDIVENAAATLVKKLLPVLDTADLALAHGGGEDVKQVAGALFDILSKEGLERIDPEGQPFDPALHDAVAHEPVEGQGAPEMPEVSEVLRAGYLWKGQVLRPAMVKVRG